MAVQTPQYNRGGQDVSKSHKLYSNLSIFILCFSGDYFKNSDYDVFLNVPSNLYFTNIFEDLVIAVSRHFV
jgi:hypothetical protein